MPLTPAERTGLEALKVKIDNAKTRIVSEKQALEAQITVGQNSVAEKVANINHLDNARESVQTILDIDAGGDL